MNTLVTTWPTTEPTGAEGNAAGVAPTTISSPEVPLQAPTIILPGGEHSITAAADQIFALIAAVGGLFYRGGRVHEVSANSDGSHRLVPITAARFRSLVETYGQLFAWRSGANGEQVLKPSLCPEETARALLESRAAGDRLPNVVMMTACPVLAPDGTGVCVLNAGWHANGGGIFVTGGQPPPNVPITEAVRALSALLDDFDFATPSDRSRALASLIAPALRFGGFLTSHLPVDIGEADASQSGKTYRQKVVAAIYRETPNIVVQRSGGVGGFDEGLSQKLIDGRPFILLDNLRGKLDSQFFEAILTAPGTMPARVPHRGEVQIDTRGFVFQITSNGVETTRDLANRASIIRIRKQPVGYPFRSYPEGDLFAHVVGNQAYYLGCVFEVVARWSAGGRQRTTDARHDFREWAQTMDWIVRNIFVAAPLLDGHDGARERVSDPRRTWLRELCIALRDANQTGAFGAAQLAEFALEHEILPPAVRADADAGSVSRTIGKVMAAVFGVGDAVEIDGFKIQRTHRHSEAAGKNVAAYHFGDIQLELPVEVAVVRQPANAANADNF